MDSVKPYLPFTPTIGGALGFVVTVAVAVWIARKVPVLNRLA